MVAWYTIRMRVLLICGSVAQKSHTRALVSHIEELLKQAGAKTEVWDLKTQPIPIVLPEYHQDPTKNPDVSVQKFVQSVENADAIVLGTPLYHGSYSGVLKNALDNLRGNAFKTKWVGLAGNTGSLRADMVAFSHLRHVVNTLVGYTIQTMVKTNEDDYEEVSGRYMVKSPTVLDRTVRFVQELTTVPSFKKSA